MKHFSASDFYELRSLSSYSGESNAVLTSLYLPLTGVNAVGVYLCLQDIAARKSNELLHFDRLLAKVSLTIGQLERSLTALEAVGLIRTFARSDNEASYFCFCLYSPMKGEDFVNDVLMYGALCSCIGEEEAMKLKKRFDLDELPQGLDEVTIPFPDYFPLSEIKPSNPKKKTKSVNTGFDTVAFSRELQKYGLSENALSEEEVETIGKLAALYHLDEETMASFAYDCLTSYRSGRAKLNQKQLEQKCQQTIPFSYLRNKSGEKSEASGDSEFSKLIRQADSMSSVEFLRWLQKGHKPASADLKILERLSLEIGLPDPVISILLHYVLQMNNNVLSSAYCEKIGAALQREGCKTARDAVDYLYNYINRKTKKKPTTSVEEQSKQGKNDVNSVQPVSEEVDWDKLLLDSLDSEDDKK